MENQKRILVTGAAGFIGQAVIKYLAQSKYDIIALCREKELPQNLYSMCSDVIKGDICRKPLLAKLFHRVDAICHIAAFIPPDYDDLSYAEKCYHTNALATLNLAIAASTHQVSRFIYISTGNMYFYSQKPATEYEPVFPSESATPYFVSKLAGEIYTSHVCRSSNMAGIILRIGTPYGPGEPKNKAIPSLLTQALKGSELTIYHGGKPRYNFVYVEDIATCIRSAIANGESGIYNVASGESTSLRKLANTIVSIFKEKPLTINIVPPSGKGIPGFTPLSITKAEGTWHYKPLNIKAGLSKYLETLRNETYIT